MHHLFCYRMGFLVGLMVSLSFSGQAAPPATPAICDDLTSAVFRVNGHPGAFSYFSDRFQQPPERWTEAHWQDASGLLRSCAEVYARRGMPLEGEQLEARGREVLEDYRAELRAQAAEAATNRQAALDQAERQKRDIRERQEKAEKAQKDAATHQARMQTLRSTMLPSRILPTLPKVSVSPDFCKRLLDTVLTPQTIIGFFEARFKIAAARWTGTQWLEARASLEGCYDFDQILYANALAVRGRNDFIERQLRLQGYEEGEIGQILREVEEDVNTIFMQRKNKAQTLQSSEFQIFQQEFQPTWLNPCYEAIKKLIADPSSFSPHPNYELLPPSSFLGLALRTGSPEWQPPNERPLIVVANYRSRNKFGALQVFQATCIYYMQGKKFYFHRVLIEV